MARIKKPNPGMGGDKGMKPIKPGKPKPGGSVMKPLPVKPGVGSKPKPMPTKPARPGGPVVKPLPVKPGVTQQQRQKQLKTLEAQLKKRKKK